MAASVIRFVSLSALLCGADVFASSWIWGRAPSDTIRVWYPGFWVFAAGRLHSWVLVFAFVLIPCIAAWHLFRHHSSRLSDGKTSPASYIAEWWMLSASLAIVSELLTSIFYWSSSRSSDLHAFYTSMDYWGLLSETPHTNAPGWPSFKLYLWGHFLPWAVILLPPLLIWYYWDRKRQQSLRSVTVQ